MADGGFRDHIGVEVRSSGDGRAVAALVAGDEHLNAAGKVHGGAIATLADVAMGEAVRSTGAEVVATIEMKLTYIDPGDPGELQAHALVRKAGSRITIVETEVTQGDDFVAHAIATFTA